MSIQDILYIIFFPWSATFGMNIFALIWTLIDPAMAFLISFFPDSGGFPSEITSAFSSIIGYMGIWNFFFPVEEMLFVIFMVIGYRITRTGLQWSFKVVNWIRGVK